MLSFSTKSMKDRSKKYFYVQMCRLGDIAWLYVVLVPLQHFMPLGTVALNINIRY